MTVSNTRLAVVAKMRKQSDDAIAEHLGVHPRTVARYRKKLGLPLWGQVKERPLTHGASAYANGRCRCAECTEAARVRHKQERASRKGRLAADDPRHGRWSTYTNWSCRCDACTHAARRWGSGRTRQGTP